MPENIVQPVRRTPRRLLSLTGAFGLVVAGIAVAQPASAAVPAFPDNVVVFPDRDFVSVEGYERYAGERAVVRVVRDGTVMGSAEAVVSGTDVAFEINHPGGECWGAGTSLKVTPDIRAGDVVSVTFPDGSVEETTTSSATASDMVQDGSTITVAGTFGPGVDPSFLEQRIIQPDLVGTAVGKRDVRALPGPLTRAPRGGYSSGMSIDAAAGTFLATYVFDTVELADTTAAADLGERAMNWQVQDADGNRQSLTISEFGEAGGPGMGGCPLGPSQQEAPAGGATAIRSADKASMQVNWTPVAPQPGAAAVTGYDVEVIEQGSLPAATSGRRFGPDARSTNLTGLDPSRDYTVEVRSMTGDRLSVPFTMGGTGPQLGDTTVPTLSITPDSGGTTQTDQVTVNSDGQVFYTTTPIGGPDVPVVTGGVPTDEAVLLPSPLPRSIPITAPVHLSVVALDQAGNLATFAGDFEPRPLPPLAAAPTGLAGTASQSAVALTWNASTDTTVTGYQVRVTTPGGTTVTTPPVTALPRQTISGLAPGTPYVFSVAAINAAGVGDFSAPITVSTPVPTDRITISTAVWKTGDFKIVGTGSQLGTTVTLYRVTATGTQGAAIPGAVATVVAAAPPGVGDWTIRLRNAAAGTSSPGRVMAVSSGGGTTPPFTVTSK
ncbi:fibronectin type III domain-containing protein [Phycicoccus avicenniae]|uniref:fibronectin type III domain-containing protein n=1 Tax=Phycicoccus avicenniae TaxID=2828860 RepID=UPI003D2E73D9